MRTAYLAVVAVLAGCADVGEDVDPVVDPVDEVTPTVEPVEDAPAIALKTWEYSVRPFVDQGSTQWIIGWNQFEVTLRDDGASVSAYLMADINDSESIVVDLVSYDDQCQEVTVFSDGYYPQERVVSDGSYMSISGVTDAGLGGNDITLRDVAVTVSWSGGVVRGVWSGDCGG